MLCMSLRRLVKENRKTQKKKGQYGNGKGKAQPRYQVYPKNPRLGVLSSSNTPKKAMPRITHPDLTLNPSQSIPPGQFPITISYNHRHMNQFPPFNLLFPKLNKVEIDIDISQIPNPKSRSQNQVRGKPAVEKKVNHLAHRSGS